MPYPVRKNLSSIFLFFRILCLFDFHLFTCNGLKTMTDQTLESMGNVANSEKAKLFLVKKVIYVESKNTHTWTSSVAGREGKVFIWGSRRAIIFISVPALTYTKPQLCHCRQHCHCPIFCSRRQWKKALYIQKIDWLKYHLWEVCSKDTNWYCLRDSKCLS